MILRAILLTDSNSSWVLANCSECGFTANSKYCTNMLSLLTPCNPKKIHKSLYTEILASFSLSHQDEGERAKKPS